MTPTDDELTIAVDAAARALFDQLRQMMGDSTRFHEIPPLVQLQWRTQALPVAAAVLEALPDRAEAAARDARRAALVEYSGRIRRHLCTCGSAGAASDDHEHWCPGSVVDGELG